MTEESLLLSETKQGGMRIGGSIPMLLQRYISVCLGADPSTRHSETSCISLVISKGSFSVWIIYCE